ncbi:MAG: hypothetical protein ACI9WU_003993 [Myxococcota bacterium]|jgi:hypothetical protein
MNITHFNDSAIDSCSGYKKPLTPENECLAVKVALAEHPTDQPAKSARACVVNS